MKTSRRLAVLGATLASAMSLASLGTPAPASAARLEREGLRPLTTVLRPVDPNDPQWVSIRWATGRRVCHVRVRVHGGREDVDVAYPGDRLYTSFPGGEGLEPGRVDSTAFRVTAHQDGPERAFLTATVDYDYCHQDSPTLNDAIGFWLPVRA
ncbi:hypothetical protein [Actinoplanes sp. NPDC051411]|uniref:hypothetical protein n=1 Tax=Actinoplanes sp. NPDC051411 TaxID=3155522 RepID=UPI00344AE75F